MVDSIPDSADQDIEARGALWRAICVASENILNRFFGIRYIHSLRGLPMNKGALPEVPTWQLVEALSLLGVILRSDNATADVINLFGKSGPIEIKEDGTVYQFWAQQTLRGAESSLNGRPDLIVTSSLEQPNPKNAIRIIEAKCVRHLGTSTIRGEFGKAYDLRVATYFIWSFYSPSRKVIKGAKDLGIDIEILGFDTDRRGNIIENPESLIDYFADAQEKARREKRFAKSLNKAGQDAFGKFFGPSR
ncbi:hypothetical protein JW948_16460 [bacterium]|nr:hypothetical protein [bacterium]